MAKIKYLTGLLILCVITCLCVSTEACLAVEKMPEQQSDNSKPMATFSLSQGTVDIVIPENTAPMRQFRIRFVFNNVSPVSALSFRTNMKMNMGKFGGIPEKTESGAYELPLTLPRCMSGDTVWHGDLDIYYESGAKEKVRFFYNLK